MIMVGIVICSLIVAHDCAALDLRTEPGTTYEQCQTLLGLPAMQVQMAGVASQHGGRLVSMTCKRGEGI